MVRDFQWIIVEETLGQMHEMEGRLPDSLFACAASAGLRVVDTPFVNFAILSPTSTNEGAVA